MPNNSTQNGTVELAIPVDTVCFIIELAHDTQGKSASTEDEDETISSDDPEAEVLEDRGEDPAEQELRSVIEDLPEDAQMDLVALMWVGRDDEDWATARDLAEQEHNDATADYLCGTPLLAGYLEAGLDALGLGCG